MSGEGDGTLTVSASGHNGRMGKTTTVTVTAANGTRPSKSFTVVQAGAGVVLTLDSSKPGLPKSGGKVNNKRDFQQRHTESRLSACWLRVGSRSLK